MVATANATEFSRAYGEGVSRDSCFNLASASKMFTLVAIEQLIEAGKLRKGDKVGAYITSYPAAADVTIEQLLSHTSGLPAGTTPDFFTSIAKLQSIDEMIAAVAAPLEFAPGSRKQYSNIGFLVLGRVVEVVSSESFEHYVTTHIAEPAGMRHTSARSNGCAQPMTRGMLMSGNSAPSMPRQPFAPPHATPAGGWSSSADDLLRFARALRDRRIVTASPESIGFGERAWGANRMIGHNGGAPGINAEFWMLNGGHTIIALSNVDPPAASQVVDDVVTILTGTRPPQVGGKILIRKP